MKPHRLLFVLLLMAVALRLPGQDYRMRPKNFELTGSIKVSSKELPRRIILEEKGSLIFKDQWGGSLSHTFFTAKARGLPADFRGMFLDAEPDDYFQTYALRALRRFSLFDKKLRMGIECGLTWVHYRSANFSYIEQIPRKLYKVTYHAKNFIGLSLRVRSDLQLSSIAGIELALVSDISPLQCFVGCELFLTGRLVKAKNRVMMHRKDK